MITGAWKNIPLNARSVQTWRESEITYSCMAPKTKNVVITAILYENPLFNIGLYRCLTSHLCTGMFHYFQYSLKLVQFHQSYKNRWKYKEKFFGGKILINLPDRTHDPRNGEALQWCWDRGGRSCRIPGSRSRWRVAKVWAVFRKGGSTGSSLRCSWSPW